MTTDELLRTLAADSFKRELDHDESIWRTLPFFATALALAVTVVTYAVARPLDAAAAPWVRFALYAGLAGASASIMRALFELWRMVRPREVLALPPDAEIVEYSAELAAYHAALHPQDEAAADAETFRQLQDYVTDKYGAVATRARAHNVVRRGARIQAIVYILAALLLAFATVIVIYSEREARGARAITVEPVADAVQPAPATRRPPSAARPARGSETARTADRGGGVPPAVPDRSLLRDEREEGRLTPPPRRPDDRLLRRSL